MTRVAIIGAMAGELKPLVRGWVHERRGNVEVWRWKFKDGEWVAACGGAGVDAATRAFAEVEKDGAADLVVSVGWAGALTPQLQTGAAYTVSGVIDARTGERFATEAPEGRAAGQHHDRGNPGHPAILHEPEVGYMGHWLVTSPKVADEHEKHRLALAYGAALVDMEAAGLARLALMRRIPFYCIKGISDGLTDKLPDFNRFIRPDGQFDLTGMVLFSILRPWYWLSLARMGENSRKASQSLRKAVLDFLDERA